MLNIFKSRKYGVRFYCATPTVVQATNESDTTTNKTEKRVKRQIPSDEEAINFTNILSSLLREKKLKRAAKKIENFVTLYRPNKIHFNQILRYYSLIRDEETATRIFKVMEKDTGRDAYTYNIMLGLYGKIGNTEKAVEIFEEMQQNDLLGIEAYNNLLNILAENEKYEEAFALYNRIIDESEPNKKTFTMIINMHSILLEKDSKPAIFQEALRILDYIQLNKRIVYDLPLYNCVLKLFATFHGVRGDTNEVLNIYREMLQKGIKPDEKTFHSLFEMYCTLYNETGIASTWKAMEDHKIKPTTQTFTIIIRMYAKKHQLEKVGNLMSKLEHFNLTPDMALYTLVIKIYIDCKQLTLATREIHKMQKNKIIPTLFLYSLVVKFSSLIGSPSKTLFLFREMKAHNRLPQIDLYNSILTMCMKQQNTKDSFFFKEMGKLYEEIKAPDSNTIPNQDTIEIMAKVYASTMDVESLGVLLNDCIKYQIPPTKDTVKIIFELNEEGKDLTDDGKERIVLLKKLCKSLIAAY
jgi:pentatricopeptide repeat protein